MNDCLAGINILSRNLKKSGSKVLDALLQNARQPTWRIVAEDSPFDLKDVLKARGYRWNGGEDGQPKAWYIDFADQLREAEVEFLRRDIFKRKRSSKSNSDDRVGAVFGSGLIELNISFSRADPEVLSRAS